MAAFRIFALLLALCAALAFIAGRELWESYGPGVSAAVEAVSAEASRFAAKHPQAACVDESFRRLAACEDVWCEVQAPIFTRRCLAEAESSPELCADVPDTMRAAVFWPSRACVDIEARSESCERVLLEVLRVCLARSPPG